MMDPTRRTRVLDRPPAAASRRAAAPERRPSLLGGFFGPVRSLALSLSPPTFGRALCVQSPVKPALIDRCGPPCPPTHHLPIPPRRRSTAAAGSECSLPPARGWTTAWPPAPSNPPCRHPPQWTPPQHRHTAPKLARMSAAVAQQVSNATEGVSLEVKKAPKVSPAGVNVQTRAGGGGIFGGGGYAVCGLERPID